MTSMGRLLLNSYRLFFMSWHFVNFFFYTCYLRLYFCLPCHANLAASRYIKDYTYILCNPNIYIFFNNIQLKGHIQSFQGRAPVGRRNMGGERIHKWKTTGLLPQVVYWTTLMSTWWSTGFRTILSRWLTGTSHFVFTWL